MKKMLFILLLMMVVSGVLIASGTAFGAVSVKEEKWNSDEMQVTSLDNATLIAGNEYIFEYSTQNAQIPTNVTWIITNVKDGTQNTYFGNPVKISFSSSGEYNITVMKRNAIVYGPKSVNVHEGPLGMSLALIGAGIAVGASGMGAAIGVGIAGASGAAAIAEDSNRFKTAFIFQAFPQTQGIYGLLIGILILMYTGALSGGLNPTTDIPVGAGLMAIGAGLSVGIAGLSAIGQGIVAATGVGVTRKQGTLGKAVVFTVLPETQAIYGLLIAILLLQGMNAVIHNDSLGTTYALAMGIAAVGIGLGMGLSGITAIGQGIAAASGSAATAQKPKAFASSMIFSVLPETQSIYALLAAIMVITSMGLMSGALPTMAPSQAILVGIGVLGIGFAVGLAGISGIGQGITAGAGAAAYVKNPSSRTRSIVLSVMSETYAIFGLLIAILIMLALGVL